MTRSTAVMVTLYGACYLGAALAGAEAAAGGQPWQALLLFGLAGVLLAAASREFHHAARALRLTGHYRHGQFPGSAGDAMAQAAGLPPGCHCETWCASPAGPRRSADQPTT